MAHELMDDDTLDKTTLSTIALLEARLLRLEHIIYGPAGAPDRPPKTSALSSLADLERRFAHLTTKVRIYAELLKIYKLHPTLFSSPFLTDPTATPPTQLTQPAVLATVLASASSYPATASALAAVAGDVPVPDPALSASLISAVVPRARGIEATQRAQAAEVAELRARSERAVRAWYEGGVLGYGRFVTEVEGRVGRVERAVRREEVRRKEDEKV